MSNLSDADLVIHDLVDGNSLYIEEYLNIYRDLFPQYVRYIPLMRQRAGERVDPSATEKWHQWLVIGRGQPIGIVGFLYNRKRNIGLLMDFAIYPKARKLWVNGETPFVKHMLNLSMQQLVEDARENRVDAPLCFAAEVEYPALVRKYKEYGYVTFPVEYFEPPSTPDLQKVSDKIQQISDADYGRMYIGAFQIPGHPFDPHDPDIMRTVLFAFLEDHYQLPSTHWLVQKVVQDIPV
ncbi:MAG: hypothetical protein H6634_03510 [Anaerolineales bacterium]|nr:hypothetical protein [Anaerolineales bacterium]